MQKRFANGTFAPGDPTDCSPNDKQVNTRQCSLQSGNTVGFYEASSWEYSWFAPHDTAHLITMMGGNVSDRFPPTCTSPLPVDIGDTDPVLTVWFSALHRRLLSSDLTTFLMPAISIRRTSRLSRWASTLLRAGLNSGGRRALTIVLM